MALGGIAWALTVGLLAYYTGHAAVDVINRYGLVGAAAIVVVVVLVGVAVHLWRRRVVEES